MDRKKLNPAGIDFHKITEDNYPFMLETRRHLHRHPELSGQEYETAAYIRGFLDLWEIPYEVIAETSTVATIEGAFPGPVVALRGDIDALPIEEKTGVLYASQNPGVMHACGHDCHTTYVLTAAKILHEMKPKIHGTVKIIFQKAEENATGAKEIMDSGVLSDVQCIAGLHVIQTADLGTFNMNYGIMSTIGAGAVMTVKTQGGSVRKPEEAKNALVAASRILSSVTEEIALRIPESHPVVMVPTQVHTKARDGEVPYEASMMFNFRTLDIRDFDVMKEVVNTLPERMSEAYGASLAVDTWGPGVAVDNDKKATDLAIDVISDAFGADKVKMIRPYMSGEDFSFYQRDIPGVFIRIGGAVNGDYHPLHTEKMLVDDRTLLYGEEFMLRYVFAALEAYK
ncbi:MAG: M20 metallopeptidase family protein [Eubacterium sp.]|jgi:amidohydrolase